MVSSGHLADVYQPGHYELSTRNMPITSTLQGWKYGFESPFKVEVYFVNTTQITDLKWGTPNPIMMRDPEFGPIRIRAFGTYTLKAIDPKALLKEIVGTDGDFGADDVTELLRSIITSSFSDTVAKLQVPALDIAGKYAEIGEALRKEVCERIDDEYGLECPAAFCRQRVAARGSRKAMDTRTSMGVIGDMQKYQQYQMGTAMTAAAENPGGGGAAEGMGLGVGMAMATQMMPGHGNAAAGAAAVPPPLPAVVWHVAVGGVSKGTFTTEQVAALIASAEIKPDAMMWTAGMPAWTAGVWRSSVGVLLLCCNAAAATASIRKHRQRKEIQRKEFNAKKSSAKKHCVSGYASEGTHEDIADVEKRFNRARCHRWR